MPTHDAVTHVETAVDSVLGQTFRELELIIVDDDSKDGTLEVLESYNDGRLRVVRRPDESGIASARNRGIAEARGEYVAQHDADDWSYPDRIRRQVAFLDANPDIALVGTGASLVDESGAVTGRRRVLECPSLEDLIDENHYVHGSVMARRSALKAIDGYEESFPSAEDYDHYLRLAESHDLANIDEPLYALRVHDESTYATDLPEKRLYHYLAILRSEGSAPDVGAHDSDKFLDRVYNRLSEERQFDYHQEVARDLLRYRDLEGSRAHSLRAIRIRRGRLLPYLLLVLSFTTPAVTLAVARAFRRLVVNPRLRITNRSCPPRNL